MLTALRTVRVLTSLVLITACSSKTLEEGRSKIEPGGTGGASSGGSGASTGAVSSGGASSGGARPGPGGAEGGTFVPVACVPGSVWKSTSAHLAIHSFGFFEGSMKYEKAAADLTKEQVAALTNLCLIEPPTMTVSDSTSYHLDVVDQNGTVAGYRAVEGDILDGDEGPITGTRTISYRSLKSFLSTFDCKTAKGGGGTRGTADGGDLPDPETLPALAADPGCFNGVFVPYVPATTLLKVPAATPGTLEIHAEDCFEVMGLRLLSPVNGEEVAASGLVTAPTCPHLEVHIDRAGSYILEAEKQNIDGAAQGRAGDFYIRMSLTP